jgi:spore germination protein YaaH
MKAKTLATVLVLAALLPMTSFAATATKLSYSAWMPYWAKASGTPMALAHLSTFNSLSPFAYEVEDDGTIKDSMKLAADPWTTLIASSSAKKVKIIPSILWIHGDAIHTVLSDKTSRTAHVDDIVAMVVRNNFDGIDIDYENKKSISKEAFSAFIKDLAVKLYKKNKLLVCTTASRTNTPSIASGAARSWTDIGRSIRASSRTRRSSASISAGQPDGNFPSMESPPADMRPSSPSARKARTVVGHTRKAASATSTPADPASISASPS